MAPRMSFVLIVLENKQDLQCNICGVLSTKRLQGTLALELLGFSLLPLSSHEYNCFVAFEFIVYLRRRHGNMIYEKIIVYVYILVQPTKACPTRLHTFGLKWAMQCTRQSPVQLEAKNICRIKTPIRGVISCLSSDQHSVLALLFHLGMYICAHMRYQYYKRDTSR